MSTSVITSSNLALGNSSGNLCFRQHLRTCTSHSPFSPHFSSCGNTEFEGFKASSAFFIPNIIFLSNTSIFSKIASNAVKSRIKSERVKPTLDEESCVPYIFENNCPDYARSKIVLPVSSNEKKEKATELSSKIIPRLTGKKIRFPLFKKLVSDLHPDSDPELIALTAFASMKSEKNPEGLVAMPLGMFDDKESLLMARTVIRKKFEEKGIKTARDIEEFKGWLEFVQEPGINSARKGLTLVEILQLAYPGIFSNFDPVVRMWLLKIGKNGDEAGSKELKIHACAWVFAKGSKVFDENSMLFNPLLVKDINWSDEFVRQGICLAYTRDKHIQHIEDTFLLAAEGLGVENIFGFNIESGEIPRWFITSDNMWKRTLPDGRLLIDDVSEYLITRYIPYKYPEYCNHKNEFLFSNFREINWSDEYKEIAPNCLQRSGIGVFDALKRVRPNWFGYDDEQIRPELLKEDGKWSSENKELTFKRIFIMKLKENGLKCTVSPNNDFISFTVKDFMAWHNSFFPRTMKNWLAFFRSDTALNTALRKGSTNEEGKKNSIGRGIAILFGRDNEISIMGNNTLEKIITGLGLNNSNEVIQISLPNKDKKVTVDPPQLTEANLIPDSPATVLPLTPPAPMPISLPVPLFISAQNRANGTVREKPSPTSPLSGTRVLKWLRALDALFVKETFRYAVGVFKNSCNDLGIHNIENLKPGSEDFERLRKYIVLNEKNMIYILDRIKHYAKKQKKLYDETLAIALENTPSADW